MTMMIDDDDDDADEEENRLHGGSEDTLIKSWFFLVSRINEDTFLNPLCKRNCFYENK